MFFDLLLLIITIFIVIYVWLTWNYDYWKRRNIPYVQPSLIFGTSKESVLMTTPRPQYYLNLYKIYPNEPVVGLFKLRQPEVMIRDYELAKIMLVREFNSFHDNDVGNFESDMTIEENPLIVNPFGVTGEKWKLYRGISSKALTSTKIKGMVDQMIMVSKDMLEYIEENQDKYFDGKYFAGQFTTDVTTSCAYGLKSNSFKDPNSEFRTMTSKIFNTDFKFGLMVTIITFFPWLNKYLKLSFIPLKVSQFYQKIVRETMQYRNEHRIERNDFLQQLMNDKKQNFTPAEISAHSFTFVIDGYETTSVALSQVLYQLAIDEPVQKKLREELQKNIKDFHKIDYDLVHSLEYLEAVIKETLRLFPPGSALSKVCTLDNSINYKGVNYVFKKGLSVVVPVVPMHLDSKYFQEPEKFCPERFLKNKDPPGYLPFGIGPRQCFGAKFAVTQIKVAVIAIILNYQVLPKNLPMKPMEYEPHTLFTIMKGGVWFKFLKL